MMFYYDHNIGDFAIETRGLTYELIGIYISLLDWYASTQKPITSEWLDVAYQGETKSKAIALLKAFFVKRDEGYVHLAIEKQIIAFEEMSRKRSEAGKKGGRRKKALPSAATECEDKAQESNRLANAFLTNNQETINQEPTTSSTPEKKRSPIVPIPLDPEPEWVTAARDIRPDVDPMFVWRKMKDYYRAEKKALTTWRRTFMTWVGREHGQVRQQAQTRKNDLIVEVRADDYTEYNPYEAYANGQ